MPESDWKDDLMLIVAGGQAGLLEMIAVYPLDTLRTRIKWRPACDRLTMRECLGTIYRDEGFLSYWKGLAPHLLVNTPKKTLKFYTYQKCRTLLAQECIFRANPVPTYMISGFVAGAIEATFINPFEIVKVTQQLNFEVFRNSPSMWVITREIARRRGFGGFYRGLDALLVHHSIFNMIYFSFYHGVVMYLPKPNATVEFLSQAALAFVASTIPSILLTPVDVARIKIQGPQPKNKEGVTVVKYERLFQTLNVLFKDGGYRMLFRGLPARILRSGSSGTVLMLVFEYGYKYLQTAMDKYKQESRK